MKAILIQFLIITVISCSNTNKTTKIIFHNTPKKSSELHGDIRNIQFQKIQYVNDLGEIVYYEPKTPIDTLTINSRRDFIEIRYRNRIFENLYYRIKNGDVVNFNFDKKKYPLLTSTISDNLTKQYNFRRDIKIGKTKFGYEIPTVLNEFYFERAHSAKKLGILEGTNLLKNWINLDSIKIELPKYIMAYNRALIEGEQKGYYDKKFVNYSEILLKNQMFTNLYPYNKGKDFCKFDDDYFYSISYRNNVRKQYIYIEKINDNLTKTYNTIYSKDFPLRTKKYLLKLCINDISEYCDIDDIKSYIKKYLDFTDDKKTVDLIVNKYNIYATKEELLLKNIFNSNTNFKTVLKKNRGKLVYVDFWASWCSPCCREMKPSKILREKYKGKDIAFLYIAKSDKFKAWKNAIDKLDITGNCQNYFITNSKSSNFLKEYKIRAIPHFLLFDKNGKLIHANAPRPSNKKIDELFQKYL
jgi:thiol-disulfide isomerase/thioredoxin